jgi:amino acid adenylation domain-containing protein
MHTYLLSHLIDRAAERFPDKTALRFDGQSLTYAEWVRRADALAGALAERGVKRGDRVGVYLNKSFETAIAIYGIWKAGAAYVPFDPLAPAQRLVFLVQDCGIRHIVTHDAKREGVRNLLAAGGQLASAFGLSSSADLNTAVMGWDAIGAADFRAPAPRMSELDLAYVMYTSGSTGAPKGLMHTHYSGMSYARLSAHTYDVRESDVLSNHNALHFDMSTFDLFTGPLCAATTVIIPEAYTKLPASLSKLIQDERITVWYSVPFALIQLATRGALDRRDCSSLRWVCYGGEPFPPAQMRALQRYWPQARFSNVYGPAEVNQCTYYHIPPLADDYQDAIPLGAIWDDSEGLIVDEHDQPALQGEIGELLVRTPTMMKGYWNRPDLTERGFYRRQRDGQFEEVFYRTGDLVQLHADGNMRFIGRKDRQIKTRGFRVELDEVEKTLSLHPAIEECAVFVTPDAEGSNLLYSAAIARPGVAVNEVELKQFLLDRLPWYAVPLNIALLREFPRTGSGKIDRRALREQIVNRAPAGTAVSAPRDVVREGGSL